GPARPLAGSPGAPQDLRRPRLRPADQLDLRPPPRFLGGRRAYQPAQDAAALLPPPPPRARRRVAGHPRGRPRRIRPPGYSGVQPAAMGRETLGRLTRRTARAIPSIQAHWAAAPRPT